MKSPIFLFLVALIVFALVGQNLSQSLPLMFLGIKLIALPVGVWVALAIAAGAITAWGISLLLPRSRSVSQRESNSTHTSKSRQRRSGTPPTPQDPELGGQIPSHRVAPQTVYTPPSKAFDDTEKIEVEYTRVTPSPIQDKTSASGSSGEEVWDDEEWESAEPSNGMAETLEPSDEEKRRVIEIRKEPIASDNQGSIYSYTYRSPQEERMASSEFADDDEDEETLDFRDIAPEPSINPFPQIDPFPQMEVIDPILEPESPTGKRDRGATPQEDRSSPKPPSQNLPEDDWGEGPNNKNEDW